MVFDTWFFSFINREVTHVDGLPLPIDQGYLRNQSPKSPNRTQQKAVFFHSQKNRLNPNKNLKVKKRILEELEVPREARTPFFWSNLVAFCPLPDRLLLWNLGETCTAVEKNEGVFPLYRDRFTGEMMMFLRRRCS